MPEYIYNQRKQHLLTSLKKLLPGSNVNIGAIVDRRSGSIISDPVEIGNSLTSFWQGIFDGKTTDKGMRAQWLSRLRHRLSVSLEELTPTMKDADLVLSSLPTSAQGPDGIPFSVFGRLRTVVAPLSMDIVQDMIT